MKLHRSGCNFEIDIFAKSERTTAMKFPQLFDEDGKEIVWNKNPNDTSDSEALKVVKKRDDATKKLSPTQPVKAASPWMAARLRGKKSIEISSENSPAAPIHNAGVSKEQLAQSSAQATLQVNVTLGHLNPQDADENEKSEREIAVVLDNNILDDAVPVVEENFVVPDYQANGKNTHNQTQDLEVTGSIENVESQAITENISVAETNQFEENSPQEKVAETSSFNAENLQRHFTNAVHEVIEERISAAQEVRVTLPQGSDGRSIQQADTVKIEINLPIEIAKRVAALPQPDMRKLSVGYANTPGAYSKDETGQVAHVWIEAKKNMPLYTAPDAPHKDTDKAVVIEESTAPVIEVSAHKRTTPPESEINAGKESRSIEYIAPGLETPEEIAAEIQSTLIGKTPDVSGVSDLAEHETAPSEEILESVSINELLQPPSAIHEINALTVSVLQEEETEPVQPQDPLIAQVFEVPTADSLTTQNTTAENTEEPQERHPENGSPQIPNEDLGTPPPLDDVFDDENNVEPEQVDAIMESSIPLDNLDHFDDVLPMADLPNDPIDPETDDSLTLSDLEISVTDVQADNQESGTPAFSDFEISEESAAATEEPIVAAIIESTGGIPLLCEFFEVDPSAELDIDEIETVPSSTKDLTIEDVTQPASLPAAASAQETMQVDLDNEPMETPATSMVIPIETLESSGSKKDENFILTPEDQISKPMYGVVLSLEDGLTQACFLSQLKTAQAYLDQGANPNGQGKIVNGNGNEIAGLSPLKAALMACIQEDATPKMIKKQTARIVKLLLERGASTQENEREIVMHCARHNLAEVLDVLGQHGIRLRKYGFEVMGMCMYTGHVEVMKCLTEFNCSVNIQNDRGNRPFLDICSQTFGFGEKGFKNFKNDPVALSKLINSYVSVGLNLEATDKVGCTALMRSIATGNDVLTKALLMAGANPRAVLKNGVSATHIATACMNGLALREFLEMSGAYSDLLRMDALKLQPDVKAIVKSAKQKATEIR